MIVTCPKCGQALMNDDNRALTDAESAELALQTCECPGARAWRSKEKQRPDRYNRRPRQG